MSYFAGRRDSSSESGSGSDSDDERFEAVQEVAPQAAAPKKKHAFLKEVTAAGDNDGDNDGEDGKIQSKYERCVENIDDAAAALVKARGAQEWRNAFEQWQSIQDDLKYLLANGMKLPYAFVSTLSDTKNFFDSNPIADLREAAPREQRKYLADIHREMMDACEKYKVQIERMDDESDEEDENEDGVPLEGTAVFREGEVVSEELIEKKLPDIRNQYGKKGSNRGVYIAQLTEVFNRTAEFPRVQAFMASLLASAYLDGPRKSGALSPNKWSMAAKYLTQLITIMSAHRKEAIELSPAQLAKRKPGSEVDNPFVMTTTVSALASRMLEEYFDGVRSTEVYSDAYLHWLKIESSLLKLLQNARGLYQAGSGAENAENVVSMTFSLLQLVYYRQQENHVKLIEKYGTVDVVTSNLRATVLKLNEYVQKHSTSIETKFHSTLCVMYHMALHNEREEAAKIFSSIRASDRITSISDADTRLMYNRVLARLAIAHFRAGNVYEAGQTILNLYSLPKYKELLGQAQPRIHAKDKTEKALRSRFVPWHMHVNTEILDVIFFLYCMIYRPKDNRLYVYRSFLMAYERQQFLGPPENSRERVFAAVKAYRKADWSTARQHILAVPCWGAFGDSREFLDPIIHTIKVESLKNFLLQTRGSYVNISATHLSHKFELEPAAIRNIVTKMLINRDISGVWDASEEYLYLESTGYSVVEQSILDLADKATMLTEFTEKVQDSREGGPSAAASGPRRTMGGGPRAPRQLSAKTPFSSLGRGAVVSTGGSKNWKK
eukprot:PhM_4_TR14199/c1_g1_i1/m.27960/K03252/EIF3C; translation initiation factor 3 subunit C